MKKLFVLMLTFVFAGALSAQSKAPKEKKESKAVKTEKREAGVKEEKAPPAEMKAEEKHNKFECPMCHMTAEKPGKCGMCKVDMIEGKAEMKKEKAEMKEMKHENHDGHGHDKAPEKKAD